MGDVTDGGKEGGLDVTARCNRATEKQQRERERLSRGLRVGRRARVRVLAGQARSSTWTSYESVNFTDKKSSLYFFKLNLKVRFEKDRRTKSSSSF